MIRLFFKGIVAVGKTEWAWFPHFHYEKGIHFGFCLFNFKLFLSLCEPADLVTTMLNVQIIHNPLPTESDN